MGIVTIGRVLLVRQLFLTILTVALGGFAYIAVRDLAALAGGLATGTPQAGAAGAAALAASANDVALYILYATIAAAVLMNAVLIPVTRIGIERPIKDMAAAVDKMAVGDVSVTIPGEMRADELGVMARGLERLRKDAAMRATQSKRTQMSDTATAHDVRTRMIADHIETFSTELVTTVNRLSAMTKRLGEAADAMIVAARHASEGSDQATGASSNAAADVSSVATASEQLLDSIEEISRQVVQSTNVVKGAVERAVDTNAGMGRLSEAAQKVGDVVSLISRIAAQTNLLALNATIEAARAGEAGRGFAVVAQEVKTLATQTAKATQDITGQIAEMQEATDLSVDAIGKIQKKISEVEHISTIIAAAVHEQGAATQEIARNVRSAAAGTASMSGHIENVVRSVGDTSTSAASVSTLARELDGIAGNMTQLVDTFTRNLKVA